METPVVNPANNNKWLIFGLAGFTVILAITAIVLFFRLNQPVPGPSPKPSIKPKTVPVQQTTTESVCKLSFAVVPSPSPSPSASPRPSPSPSPSPEPISCFDTCGSDTDCETDLRCLSVGGTYRCVNPSCPEDVDCFCASSNPSPMPSPSPSPLTLLTSPKPSASPIIQAQLPEAGFNAPLVLGVSAGILMILLGLVF